MMCCRGHFFTHWPLRDQCQSFSNSEIVLMWMLKDLTDDYSILVQIMAMCSQATSHYLSQCRPRFMSLYGVAWTQWGIVQSALFKMAWCTLGNEWLHESTTLTHCGLVMPYNDRYLCQHWLRQWLGAWWYQAMSSTNIDLSSVRYSDIHLIATSSDPFAINH